MSKPNGNTQRRELGLSCTIRYDCLTHNISDYSQKKISGLDLKARTIEVERHPGLLADVHRRLLSLVLSAGPSGCMEEGSVAEEC